MSDSYDLSEILNKFKRTKLVLFKDVIRNVFQMFLSQNILSDIKNGPSALFNRLFDFSGRRQIYNVLVLVADLETNVGAACIELLNNEVPELLKHFNYRQNFSIFDDNLFNDDYMDELFDSNNDQSIFCPAIEPINNNILDEFSILDANLSNEDQIITQINPDYLMQISLTSNSSANTVRNIQPDLASNNNQSRESINILDMKDVDWKPLDTSFLTEVSISNTSYEWGDKENDFSDYESDEEVSEFGSEYSCQSLPKPIQREINQLRRLGIPFDYQNITQSSHERFKIMRSNPNLTKSQIASMVNARRRFINRKAATRCRTQKVQQKDQLKIELKKLEEKLNRTRITLTKAYHERNKLKDSLKESQHTFLSRLVAVDGRPLSPKKWSTEFVDSGKSVIVRENAISAA